jgi:hypothetical protein
VAETPDDWFSIHAWVEIIKRRLKFGTLLQENAARQ